jgi:hypothetical protein
MSKIKSVAAIKNSGLTRKSYDSGQCEAGPRCDGRLPEVEKELGRKAMYAGHSAFAMGQMMGERNYLRGWPGCAFQNLPDDEGEARVESPELSESRGWLHHRRLL